MGEPLSSGDDAVLLVPCKNLVSTVSAESYLVARSDLPREKVRRKARGVSEGLVVAGQRFWQGGKGGLLLQVRHTDWYAQPLRCCTCKRGLIETRFSEAY